MTMLDELATYLEDQNVGTVGTTIFVDWMPATPDDALALYEYAGLAPEFTHDDTTPLAEKPRVQVKARSASHATGRAKIQDAYLALNRVYNMTLSGTLYHRITPLQQPFYLRRDENERVEFVVNFQISKAVSP